MRTSLRKGNFISPKLKNALDYYSLVLLAQSSSGCCQFSVEKLHFSFHKWNKSFLSSQVCRYFIYVNDVSAAQWNFYLRGTPIGVEVKLRLWRFPKHPLVFSFVITSSSLLVISSIISSLARVQVLSLLMCDGVVKVKWSCRKRWSDRECITEFLLIFAYCKDGRLKELHEAS